ncbi:N-alpha-acetyltransferase 40 isoform X2 [Vanacampus margaritifer]
MSADKLNKEQIFTRLKKDVRSLLISSKDGLTPNQLMRDYSNMLGHPMPLQLFGFGNVLAMAPAMPDVFSVTRDINGYPVLKAVGDNSTKHIEQLVAMQKKTKKKSTDYSHQYQPAPIPYRPKVFLPLETLRAQLHFLLCQGPFKLYDLHSCYLRCFRRPLNPHNFGFNTIREMLDAAADLVYVQPTNLGLILNLRGNESMVPNRGNKMPPRMPHSRIEKQGKTSATSIHSHHEPAATAAAEEEREVDPDLDQKLLLERSSGKDVPLIENNHLPIQPAEDAKGHGMVLMASGGTGRVDSSQMGIIKEEDPSSMEVHQDETLDTSEDSHTKKENPEKKPDAEVCRYRDLTLDDVRPNQRLKRPTRHDIGKVMPVQVEHVESPGHFYISSFESDESRALLDLMFEMRRFYTRPDVSALYRLPPRFVRRGQACCLSTASYWFYRVVIERVASGSRVEVYFVDYGQTFMVLSAKLKFLKMCFYNLPAQAIPASLVGIRPATGTWTPEATACFQSLCSEHVLKGALKCYAGDVLQLYLFNTCTNIHDVMIGQGHAVACWSSSRLCVRNSPVSLYLGDGAGELQDVEEMLGKMPGLEPIMEEGQDSCYFLGN